jgi:hypothetical protein
MLRHYNNQNRTKTLKIKIVTESNFIASLLHFFESNKFVNNSLNNNNKNEQIK